jgi:hypothetical protein
MKKITILIILINLVLSGVQLAISIARATDGEQLSRLESQLESIKLENQRLGNSIYSYASTGIILDSAKASHLTPAKISYMGQAPVAAALTQP